MRSLSNLSAVLAKYNDLEEMLEHEFSDLGAYKVLRTDEPVFECDCSVEKLTGVLLSLGQDEVEDILREQGDIELTCHFCNKSYVFHEYEVKKIFELAAQK